MLTLKRSKDAEIFATPTSSSASTLWAVRMWTTPSQSGGRGLYRIRNTSSTVCVGRYLANGCVELGVHISDVSFFVRPGSLSDAEARRRWVDGGR